jgi:hypothetical protein
LAQVKWSRLAGRRNPTIGSSGPLRTVAVTSCGDQQRSLNSSVSPRRTCPLASRSLKALLVLLALNPFACSTSVAGPEESCANASIQSQNLRVEKEKNATVIQILDKSAHWRVVFRSLVELYLPRQSQDTNFLTYVSSEGGSFWLYLQRLSTGAREPVSALDSKPTNLCFDSAASVIHVVFSSGAVTDYDITSQLRLLPGR